MTEQTFQLTRGGVYRPKGGKVWWLHFSIKRNGQPSEQIRKSTGKRKKADAVEVLDAEKADTRKRLAAGEPAKVPDGTIPTVPSPEIALDDYLKDQARRGKRTDSYRKLDNDWRPVIKERSWSALTLTFAENQLAEWKDGRKWSAATYNNALSQLSGFLSFAYRRGWIERHPLQGRAERMETNNGRERYPLPHELAAMETEAVTVARERGHADADWLKRHIVAAPFTGLRRGVHCALRCQDVRKDERKDLWLRVAQDKNGKPVEKRLVGEVKAIVEARLESALPGAFLFPGPDGGNAYTSLARYLPVVVERVGQRNPEWDLRWGIKDGGITFHSFRHAMASLALNAGVPMDVVQKMGNWQTGVMVKRYAHRADSHIRDGEERLAEILYHDLSKSGKTAKKRERVSC